MESSSNAFKENDKENERAKPNPILESLKSDYFLQKLFNNLLKKKSLDIIKYNKNMKDRLNISIKDYKEYCNTFTPIEIEIIPCKDKYGRIININEDKASYYHIYFNDNKEKIKNKYYIDEKDKVTKIRIIIDYQIKSFKNLFKYCKCIEYINCIKFNRNNITNMSSMFNEC